MIVLGGMGNVAGAVLGGFIIAALEVFSITLGGSNYRDALTFFLLFLVLVVRPQGLLGRAATAPDTTPKSLWAILPGLVAWRLGSPQASQCHHRPLRSLRRETSRSARRLLRLWSAGSGRALALLGRSPRDLEHT